MTDPDIERIQNLPIEERKQALIELILKWQDESPETAACVDDTILSALPADFDIPRYNEHAPQWRKCSEEMPEAFQVVLGWINNPVAIIGITMVYFNNNQWLEKGTREPCDITHWMPLPKAPND